VRLAEVGSHAARFEFVAAAERYAAQ